MHKLLIIIPYRNRQKHLDQLIPHLDNVLTKQNITYKIVVVEQDKEKLFNRGMLCNIGFDLYNNESNYVCFHDVDMVCESIDYSYSNQPVCLITSRTKNYEMYDKYFGGITIFDNQQFIKINGFSNKYWGWGAEDDDLFQRCQHYSVSISPRRSGICTDLEMTHNSINRANNPHYSQNLVYLHSKKTIESISADGLSNIKLMYKILNTNINNNYIKITVEI